MTEVSACKCQPSLLCYCCRRVLHLLLWTEPPYEAPQAHYDTSAGAGLRLAEAHGRLREWQYSKQAAMAGRPPDRCSASIPAQAQQLHSYASTAAALTEPRQGYASSTSTDSAAGYSSSRWHSWCQSPAMQTKLSAGDGRKDSMLNTTAPASAAACCSACRRCPSLIEPCFRCLLQRAVKAQPTQLGQFHSADYIDFLARVTPDNMGEYSAAMGKHNFNDDCPVFDGLFEYCRQVASAVVLLKACAAHACQLFSIVGQLS